MLTDDCLYGSRMGPDADKEQDVWNQRKHTQGKFQSKMLRNFSREQGGLYVSGNRRGEQAAS